jgi:hypothetical protein
VPKPNRKAKGFRDAEKHLGALATPIEITNERVRRGDLSRRAVGHDTSQHKKKISYLSCAPRQVKCPVFLSAPALQGGGAAPTSSCCSIGSYRSSPCRKMPPNLFWHPKYCLSLAAFFAKLALVTSPYLGAFYHNASHQTPNNPGGLPLHHPVPLASKDYQ